ncbi:MAG: cell division protein FtsZ [Polaromonas sp.]|jgi:cell division protein FtsZ
MGEARTLKKNVGGADMALNLTMPDAQQDLRPRITVFGVGGAGGNAVDNMIDKQLEGVEFVIANTDAQALQGSKAKSKIQMGARVTEGLGAGARPSVGSAAAEESIEEIVDHLAGSHMCFITAGMGGGTGTGAAPIIAQAARELGVLTVGVVTKPFQFEGAKRMRQAEEGVEVLQKVVDTLIIIPNQNLFRLANERTTFTEAFSMADDVLYQGVKGVTDLMVKPGLINLDFADVRAVMDEMGKAMMGTGEASGEDRAREAAEKAIANPLLDEISLVGAKGVLINITGGYDLTLFELDEAATLIREKVDPHANIIVGSTLDTSMENTMRVSVVATGIDAEVMPREIPVPRRTSINSVGVAQEELPAPAYQPVVESENYEEAQATYDDAAYDDQPHYEQGYGDAQQDTYAAPQPVYRPDAVTEAPARHSFASRVPEPAAPVQDDMFVAPKGRPAGQPSAEALARLRSAVSETRAQTQAHDISTPSRSAGGEKRGFGINSLINRMTGQQGQEEAPAARQPARPADPRAADPAAVARPVRPQVAVSTPNPAPRVRPEAPLASDDQDRVEIPAFLRRQAN